MYVKREKVDQLLETTSEKFNNKNVLNFVDKGYMEVFQMILDDIADNHKYQEGEALLEHDFNRIQRAVKYTIDEMQNIMGEQPLSLDGIMQALAEDIAEDEDVPDFDDLNEKQKKYFTEKALKTFNALSEPERQRLGIKYDKKGKLSQKERVNYDPFSAMMIVNDHMYAMVMKTLGCPDVPEFFGNATKTTIANSAFRAEWEIRERDYKNTLIEKSFDRQRGINAKKLVKTLNGKKDLINQRNATPLDVAQYAGEYFALKKRQENHTDLWRYFHKNENKKRMQLLAEMKEILEAVIGKQGTLDDSKMTPIKISEIYGREVFPNKMNQMFKSSIVDRNQMTEDSFGYEAIIVEGANKNEQPEFDGNLRESMQLDRSLFKDSNPVVENDGELDNERISASKIEEKEIDIDDLVNNHPLSKL